MGCKRMKSIYTLVIYIIISVFISKINCFELDISQVLDYSRGSSTVSVLKTGELQNLYTHKFDDPTPLKEIYNGAERLYFDPLLVNDQVLLSASVVWSLKSPSVIQLNLDKSSILLINENDASLDVQAIFSEKLVTNISPRIHSKSEVPVDINLSQFQDYNSDTSQVLVTNIEFADERFKSLTNLVNYCTMRSSLKTFDNETEPVPSPGGSQENRQEQNQQTRSVEKNLEIPNKDKIYSVQVYSYNNFPLIIEFLYTFNKRKFYSYTPEEKWKHVVFPTIQDPTFPDLLYNRLNYYGCKNGFKYTIDISQKTDYAGQSYKIENYCNLDDKVVTIENNIDIPFYTDRNYSHGKYRCFEHTPKDKTRFYVDHLKAGTSVLQLPATPNIIKVIRVYHHLDLKPFLITFVDDSDVLYHYTYEEKVWRRDKVVEGVSYDQRFTTEVRTLLDQLLAEDKREGKKVHKLIITEEAINLMTDTVRILTWFDSESTIDTYKRDRELKKNNQLKISEFDIWWYSYYSDTTLIGGSGLLEKMLLVKNKPNCAISPAKYYGYSIHDFDEGVYVHRIDYYHDKKTRDMTVYLYTNALFVYVFRKNYREASDVNWKFLEVKPTKVLEMYDTYSKYYELMKKLNNFTFNVGDVVASPVNLLQESLNIKFSKTEIRKIPTIRGDNINKNLKKIEFDVSKHKEINESVTSEGDLDTMVTIVTKDNVGIKTIKHEGLLVKNFEDDRTLVHIIKYSMDKMWKNVTIELYTNTLYHYTYTMNKHIKLDDVWTFISKKPAITTNKKELEKYFQITAKFENFNFG
ncbi:hypothetical protein MACK_002472 [Theileria orientalis]|uniref:Uncharacterized protein n=1 Tax=Theileria orientalis TaxID=68886 RepID=A0A976MC33_THEOR|nr:hypothetical protein MACK_002472 [Theileria orientalis]